MKKEPPSDFVFDLNGFRWLVTFLPNEEFRAAFGKCVAITIIERHAIFIDYEQEIESLRHCLLHELFHAACAPALGSRDDKKKKIDEELAANLMANALYQLFKTKQFSLFFSN